MGKLHSAGQIQPVFFFFTLQYCIGFAIYQHESTMGVHPKFLTSVFADELTMEGITTLSPKDTLEHPRIRFMSWSASDYAVFSFLSFFLFCIK